ncbi:CPBP family intramembrane glutamic endopeptidase [Butyrivibrio sp. XPD2006]|uniref:CPBP family intramembrane glutamic endopeptidase n=1 Tax=Butyrivibrio sp. XPD2006 TaxID=1280668 RepID=UPI0003B3963C|nr:type II CAAX endopeptidase family protein [Butyrivibrio sp. XPD2006]
MSVNERKKLYVFFAVAFGVTAIMSVFMFIGLRGGKDLTAFVNAMMTYPACGVILGMLFFDRKEKKLPMVGFGAFLVTALIMMIIALISVFAPEQMIDSGAGIVSNWNLYSQYVLIAGSVVSYIAFWACGREKRENTGLCRKNIVLSIVMILVFLVLFFGRFYTAQLAANVGAGEGIGDFSDLNAMVFNPMNWLNAAMIMINFPITMIAFLGEEYGWRYYLQPIMQKKFGLRLGVILVGVIWGVWHTAADFMFYSTDSGPQLLVTQIITCVTMGIFFGYAYMKTQNIWTIAIMHFINNNYVVIFTGGDVNVLQNQSLEWSHLPIMLFRSLIFALFILAPIFNKKKVADDINTLDTAV